MRQAHTSLRHSALALLLASSALHAQTNPTSFTNPEPFKPIAAYWKTQDGIFEAVAKRPAAAGMASKWHGKFWGLIQNDGTLYFKASNGCVLVGSTSRFTNRNHWLSNVEVQGCEDAKFNQKYFGPITRKGNTLSMSLDGTPFGVNKDDVSFKIQATFIPYKPDAPKPQD